MQVRVHAQKFLERLFKRLKLKRKANLSVAKLLCLPKTDIIYVKLCGSHVEFSEEVLEKILIKNLFTKQSRSCVDETELLNKPKIGQLFDIRKMKRFCNETATETSANFTNGATKSEFCSSLSFKKEYEIIFDEKSQIDETEKFGEWKDRVLCLKNVLDEEIEDEEFSFSGDN